MSGTNWCEVCQETCQDHPTMCSVCGTALTARTQSNSSSDENLDGMEVVSDQLLQDMRDASRDLQEILGNLRGQVQDLDVLTRNILQEQENLPQEVWDPQQQTPCSRPTSKDALKKLPRFVLNDQSTLFRQANLKVIDAFKEDDCPRYHQDCLWSTAPAHTSSTIDHSVSIIELAPSMSSVTSNAKKNQFVTTPNDAKETTNNSTSRKINSFDCILGEFGPSGEFLFDCERTALVIASPLTGKGGELDFRTKRTITEKREQQKKVVVFMLRGDGLTYVQKAYMAQEAGASAVIIGNNTSSPWPYVMKDSKGESKVPGKEVKIPVAMIKEDDGKNILKMFETRQQKIMQYWKEQQSHQQTQERQSQLPPVPKHIVLGSDKEILQSLDLQPSQSIHSDSGDTGDNTTTCNHNFSLEDAAYAAVASVGMVCSLKITSQSCDCPVCCEQLQNSETIVQLPGCGHIFHEACALHWLKAHNTCPYCRRELPTDDPEYEISRRQRQQQQQQQTMEAIENGASFYG